MVQTLRAVSMTSPTLMSHALPLSCILVLFAVEVWHAEERGNDSFNPNIMIHRFKNNWFYVLSDDEMGSGNTIINNCNTV